MYIVLYFWALLVERPLRRRGGSAVALWKKELRWASSSVPLCSRPAGWNAQRASAAVGGGSGGGDSGSGEWLLGRRVVAATA